MKKSNLMMAFVISFIAMHSNANAQMKTKTDNTVIVGEESMYPLKNIIENAVNSKDHTTLVAAVKAAGLV